jgi:mono/diheme cytochrome c family protein
MDMRRVLMPGLGFLMVIGVLAACGVVPQQEVATNGQADEASPDGQALYEAQCASCHGINGEGQPNWQIPNADGVFPAPPHTSDGHTWHHPDQLLLEITANGGGLPNSGMPGFADKLTEPEMEAILDYIKTFWDPETRDIQADVSQRWEEQTQ